MKLIWIGSAIIMLLSGANQADKKSPSFVVPALRNIEKVELLDIKTEKGSIIT
jgi:hypothetical protein